MPYTKYTKTTTVFVPPKYTEGSVAYTTLQPPRFYLRYSFAYVEWIGGLKIHRGFMVLLGN